MDAFVQRLQRIRSYVERGDGDDWKRGLVCGIIFLTNSIAIHIQQFRLLLGKCKSSINGSLQQIGFIAHPQGGPIEQELYFKVPIFQREHSEVKKWTVRDNTAPVNPLQTNLNTENKLLLLDIDNIGFECIEPNPRPLFNVPVKFRYKYYALTHQTASTQTDA